MGDNLDLKLRLKAVDKISATMDRVKGNFPRMTKAVDNASRSFKRMQARSKGMTDGFSKLGNKMKNVGQKMTLGVTAPIAGLGIAMINANKDFQESFNKVVAKATVTTKTFDDLKKQAMDLGSSTQFSASQAAEAMNFLAQAGFKTGEIYNAVPAVLDLAASSGIELGRAADIASNVMGAFNMTAEKTGHIADVMARATARSNIDMEMLAEAMKDAGPVAQKYGLSLEETTSLIGKLGDAGIQGSKAGTTLKNMFLQLSAGGKPVNDILKALGVQAVDPVTGKMRSLTAVLADMSKALSDKKIVGAKRLEILNKVFGKRAIAGAGVLLDTVAKIDPATGKAVNAVAELTKELENSDGAAGKMAKTMRKGLPGAIDRLKSSFEGLLLSIGIKGGVNGAVEKLLDKISGLFSWMSTLSPATIKIGLAFAGVLAIIGPIVTVFGVFLTMLPSMVMGFNLMKAGMLAFKLATIGANVALLPYIAALGLLATSAVMIWRNWEPIKGFFADLFTSPMQQVKEMIGWIGKLTGISKLFGAEDINAKLEKQGFKVQEMGAGDSGAKGAPIGAKEITKKTIDQKTRLQKAQVDINFSNMPKDTRVITEDRENILGALSGSMGGI